VEVADMSINAYPLQWPVGWKRTPPADRTWARFKKAGRYAGYGDQKRYVSQRDLTIAEGRKRVLEQLARMGLTRDDVVISANLVLRMDGEPRSDQKAPADPGVAVYWQEASGARRVMAIDQYTLVQDNLAAIAATLDAMRAIERHGGAMILERAFTGFAALPAPGAKREWWEVLGIDRSATVEAIRGAYRVLASKHHPDKPGGSHEKMAELNAAQEAALQGCAS
jgi:hypothetical protein